MTAEISSHILAEVAQTVDDVIIINKGRLVTISPLAELVERRTGAVRVRARDAHKLRAKLETEGIQATLLDGDELLVEGAPSARIGEIAYQAGTPLDELVSESSSLEDIFLELTTEEPS
jgi:ABC-2 type transport system ATP-binding protein